jgi:precorrin isomerase
MTSLITTTELVNVTGSQLSATILQAIIDDAELKVKAYLAPKQISATGDTAKAAVMAFSKAGAAQYHKPDADVTAYHKEGYALLDQLIDATADVQPVNQVGYMYVVEK